MDPLVDQLKSIFCDNNLMAIQPQTIVPTWHNGKAGSQHISKRLDRYLVHEDLMHRMGFIQLEVLKSYISDHFPISLL